MSWEKIAEKDCGCYTVTNEFNAKQEVLCEKHQQIEKIIRESHSRYGYELGLQESGESYYSLNEDKLREYIESEIDEIIKKEKLDEFYKK